MYTVKHFVIYLMHTYHLLIKEVSISFLPYERIKGLIECDCLFERGGGPKLTFVTQSIDDLKIILNEA